MKNVHFQTLKLTELEYQELVSINGGGGPSATSSFWYDLSFGVGWLVEKALEGAQEAAKSN